MSARDLYVYTRDQLRTKQDSVKKQVCGGKAKDFAEYKNMVGRIAGIEDALAELEASMRKYHSGDINEDEQ